MSEFVQRIRKHVRLPAPLFKLLNRGKPAFECPVCGYQGPFRDMDGFAGLRLHVECPACGTYERHRLQYLVVMDILARLDPPKLRMLHVAPEPFFQKIFSGRFGRYETADLFMKGVDHRVDLQNIQFADATYDFVFASHVLEHIPDDVKAIREIRRILKPGGIAVLPVPVVAYKTIEYPEANPREAGHLRAPGLDYPDKFRPYFSRVEARTSESVPEKYQPFIFEDRSGWPTKDMPRRLPMHGARHVDVVPICYV